MAIAMVLAWPTAGDAASKKKKAKARAATVTQQVPRQEPIFYFSEPRPQISSNRAWDVWVQGEYRGADPDPNIRSMLARDDPWADDN
jgi:hypothetical protein